MIPELRRVLSCILALCLACSTISAWSNSITGLVIIGAYIDQWVALKRSDLVRYMVNMGCWTYSDGCMRDQLNALGPMYEKAGFIAFQELVERASQLVTVKVRLTLFNEGHTSFDSVCSIA